MEDTKELVKLLYKTEDGKPFEMTDSQILIFDAIFKKKHPRVHIETHTRFGKSETVSMAVLTRVATYPEKWSIVAGTKEKAGIIMSAIIRHIFDNEYTKSKFVMGKGESIESIRRYKNKDRINFNVGNGLLGEVYITTAQGAMGFGAPNIVEDESALISEKDHALVMRMLGDKTENFLCKIGNPWTSDHFVKSYEDPLYKKIIVDYHQGLKEGRLTQEYIEEMKKQPFFGVLYECKRPEEGSMDERGWIPLLTRTDIERAFVTESKGFGINKLGLDIAGGGRNMSVAVQRHTNVARIIAKINDSDTMNFAELAINLREKLKISPYDMFTDSIGIGKGVYDILNRTKETAGIHGVQASSKPSLMEQERFVNLRAEMYWKARQWILNGGKLIKDDDWYQLTKIRYRIKLEGTRGKMAMMSKEDMLKEGTESPDVADAFAMTFVTDDIPPMDPEVEAMIEREEDRKMQFGNPFSFM